MDSSTSSSSNIDNIESQTFAATIGPQLFISAGDGSNVNLTTPSPNPPSPPLAEMPPVITLDKTKATEGDSTASSAIGRSTSPSNSTVEPVRSNNGLPIQPAKMATAPVSGGSLVPRTPKGDKTPTNHNSTPKPSANLPVTACPESRVKPTKQPSKTTVHYRASSATTSDSCDLAGSPAVVTSTTVEAPGATDITLTPAAAVKSQVASVNSSAAVMPLTPIPPPPPLANVATTLNKRQPSRQQQQQQREGKSAAMSPSPTQHRTLALSTSRAHPHPTRHHSKGKGAAARRKEKRRVAKAAVVPPVFSSTLRSAAQIFVPSSSPPPHIPTVTHVVHWFHHGGFPWSPWDEKNWSVPYFY